MGASIVHLVLQASHSFAICILTYLFVYRYFHYIDEGNGGRTAAGACIQALTLCSVFYPILLLSPKRHMQIKQNGCNFFQILRKSSPIITSQADLG